jgi:hypothetical protein
MIPKYDECVRPPIVRIDVKPTCHTAYSSRLNCERMSKRTHAHRYLTERGIFSEALPRYVYSRVWARYWGISASSALPPFSSSCGSCLLWVAMAPAQNDPEEHGVSRELRHRNVWRSKGCGIVYTRIEKWLVYSPS